LFVRPAGSTQWKLVTPPGAADNGGLVVADAGGQSLITGFRPSQYLTYTPLTATRDGGQVWAPAGPLDAAVANIPDALAIAPGTGQLLPSHQRYRKACRRSPLLQVERADDPAGRLSAAAAQEV
jgi:hypothetical protein